ncbi:unnamed protein product [Thelazia callipaeda]|uniref:Ovule protein n=1 Tax=Thelazia callipaeda TaxID=103827 RepID=A0A0N5D4T6_THECL|nr:unnamed protein product [Thelazia callipaeda]
MTEVTSVDSSVSKPENSYHEVRRAISQFIEFGILHFGVSILIFTVQFKLIYDLLRCKVRLKFYLVSADRDLLLLQY